MEDIEKFEGYRKVFGTFDIKGDVKEVVKSAINSGYRHIDTAALYNNEVQIGEAISELILSGQISRSSLMITTKVWCSQFRFIQEACRASLSRLHLSYIDIYLLHWPIPLTPDHSQPPRADPSSHSLDRFPLHEAWSQMETLVDLGLVRHIGVSNWPISLLHDLLSYCRIPPAVNQLEFHPYNKQNELIQYCRQHNVRPFAYRVIFTPHDPQYCGLESTALEDPVVLNIAHKLALSSAQVILSWAWSKPVGIIVKSSKQENIYNNFHSTHSLSAADISLIDSLPDKGFFTDPYPYFHIHIFK